MVNRDLRTELKVKGEALAGLCRKYDVDRLDVFGSGATDAWHPGESDLDFIVAFRPLPGSGLADRYLGLADDLELLFGRPVDLLTENAIRNPYFRQSVEATRATVYAA